MLVTLLMYFILGIPLWRICQRTATSPAVLLLLLFPVVGFGLILAIIAFRQWPANPENGGLR
ncbi:hypothetical protein [Undibacterium squillarum]|uniref:Uncharacterized protein n=1 Tax=Undibacterium squillarum TaxID=1131567 RepID=A0ABQ2Y0N9_9BURK|nr:hypothetical protein [Undibacterium squillarum]GGX47540.1 hypothetical protein GCM10010946_27530 [Undibacterium squillarum]